MMLPYLFAVKKHNYSKWLLVYILDTTALPAAIDSEFRDGKFNVYQSPSLFRGMSSDLAVIKDCHKIFKSDGGNVGITHKNPAVMRWSLIRHITGQYVKVKIDDEDTHEQSKDKEHALLQPSKLKQDAEHARIIEEH